MAVKRRLNGYSGMRVDWPHVRSIESAASFDFDSVLRGLVTGLNQPYLLRGFNIVIPNAAIAASSLQLIVSDSAVLHSSAAESGTILTVPAGTPNEILDTENPRVVGAFQNGVANYVGLSYVRETDTTTVDQTAGWSQSQKTEFQRTTPIGRTLDYNFVITTSGFGTNLPLYIVGTTAQGAVSYITKAVPSLFRLGRGGTVPDPQYQFSFGNLSNPQTPLDPRREWVSQNMTQTSNPVTVSPGDNASAFAFGDFSITNLKDWMDAIMTRFREITGSAYWYTDSQVLSNVPSVFDVWWDSAGSVLTGSGYMSYNEILETVGSGTSPLSYGAFQSQFTDPAILPGDSYIVGIQSGTVATLGSINSSQLIINSLTKNGFVFGETLYDRRIFRPAQASFFYGATVDGSNVVAYMRRLQLNMSPTLQPITSWSYSAVAPRGADITIQFAAPHTFNVGDFVGFQGLVCASNQPDGVFVIKNVTDSTHVQFSTSITPTGVATVSSANGWLDVATQHPYLPKFPITSWQWQVASGPVNQVTITVPSHALAIGQSVIVRGLAGAGINIPNGKQTVLAFGSSTIVFNVAAVPGAPQGVPQAVLSGSTVVPNEVSPLMTVTGATPDSYNVVDQATVVMDEAELSYIIGPSSMLVPPNATGSITMDGIVGITTVADPAQVISISFNPAGTGTLTVTTVDPHGYSAQGNISFTIFGNQSLSPFITTFNNVNLASTGSNTFELTLASGNWPWTGTPATYTNPPGYPDQVFARYPNNPYPGPIQWTSDMITQSIIGDKYIRIPATAVAVGDPGSDASNFGPGTAYLADGEVAYVVLDRNRSVSNGASYSTLGGNAQVIGSAPLIDPDGNYLRFGDFLKFESEDETKWFKISTIGYAGYSEGDTLPVSTSIVTLVGDNNQLLSSTQRPAASGKLVFFKGTYSTVLVKSHWEIDSSTNVYWIAVRQDNGSTHSKIYLRDLEMEPGEVRAINDNEMTNLLSYTGAKNEAAVAPNYTQADTIGAYQWSQSLQVGPNVLDIDVPTRMVSFVAGPDRSFEIGDQVIKAVGLSVTTYNVKQVISSKTVIFKEDVSGLSLSDNVVYHRVNYAIQDSDNLTLAIRKDDRELGRVNTALNRPIYDETIYLQQIAVSGAGIIKSGDYIYLGTQSNPSALAWVLHGTAAALETIEGSVIGMPGGSLGAANILVHVLTPGFTDGSTLLQAGGSTGFAVNNPSNPAFLSPAVPSSTSLEIVLPPNRRTQTIGVGYVQWPSDSVYKASLDPTLTGEELLVIANDQIRSAGLDYSETFGGPRAKIQLLRDMPANTRMRFRIMPAYGSAIAALAGNVTLQLAYNGGNIVNLTVGRPVTLIGTGGDTVLSLQGNLRIQGSNLPGVGIMPDTDKCFDIGTESNRVNRFWTSESHTKTHTGYPGSDSAIFTTAFTTPDSTPLAAPGSNIPVADGQTVRVKIKATARRSEGVLHPGTQGMAGFELHGTFYRDGGSTQAAGSPLSLVTGAYGDGLTYALAFGISGNDIVAIAYGGSLATEWALTIESQAVSLP